VNQDLLLRYLRQYQADPTSRVFAPLADLYRKMGKVEEALKICLDGLSHHPRYSGGRVALGHCYYDLEHLDQALKEYEYVLSYYPDNLQAMKGAAQCLEKLNKPDKAIRYYRMYLFLVPKDMLIRERLAVLEQRHRGSAEPPPAPSGERSISSEQLSLGKSFEASSPLDHYRLSTFMGRPAQRTQPPPAPPPSSDGRVQFLYKLLRVIQGRRAVTGQSGPDGGSPLDGAHSPSA
jgi:tetratricopeptide (TPR) repeat protein